MRLLDLFSGIGGFSLGLERAGFKTVAFCEIDPFCRRVLAKHWPGVPCYDDVRALTAARLAADGVIAGREAGNAVLGDASCLQRDGSIDYARGDCEGVNKSAYVPQSRDADRSRIDAICGGFPCQDISTAGKGAGIDGERSGLWREYARLVRELRPRWVIIENVPALRTRGADRVLGDLEEAGYAAWPLVVGAVHAGAPHKRQRVWIVADASGARRREDARGASGDEVADEGWCEIDDHLAVRNGQGDGAEAVAHTAWFQPGRPEQRPERQRVGAGGEQDDVADALRPGWAERRPVAGSGSVAGGGWWLAEPDVGRVAHGVPQRVDRLRALGNAVVPQVVEAIGRAVMSAGRRGWQSPAGREVNETVSDCVPHRSSTIGATHEPFPPTD